MSTQHPTITDSEFHTVAEKTLRRIETCFENIFNSNEIYCETIQDNVKTVWGFENVSDISLFRHEQTFYKKNEYFINFILIK